MSRLSRHRSLLNKVRLELIANNPATLSIYIMKGVNEDGSDITIKMRPINSKAPTWNSKQYGKP